MFEILKKWLEKDSVEFMHILFENVEIEKFSCGMVYCAFLKLEILIVFKMELKFWRVLKFFYFKNSF